MLLIMESIFYPRAAPWIVAEMFNLVFFVTKPSAGDIAGVDTVLIVDATVVDE
jgi:hypothetical protein